MPSLNQNFPFNFNPHTVTATNSGIVIPSDKYAFVSVTAKDGDSFILNGTTVLTSRAESIIPVAVSGSGTYVVPSGYIFEGSGFARGSSGGVGSVDVNGAIVVTSDASGSISPGVVRAASGQTITAGGTNFAYFAGYAIRTAAESTNTYWLKANDVVTGTADLVVSLFQIP